VRSHVNERFRKAFDALPDDIQRRAREAYARWHENPSHPSLQYKKVHETQPVYSVRIGLGWRALGLLRHATRAISWQRFTRRGAMRIICVHNCVRRFPVTERVGVRELRQKLAEYLESGEPIEVMRHGQTVGFFIPVPRRPGQSEREALLAAGRRMDAELARLGLTEDELAADFRRRRKARGGK
jgi:antitoxin (DNA-binding transcriptional repressor) of toxin-antitoxin stability system